MEKVVGLAGMALFVLVAWVFSHTKNRVSWRTVFWGLGLQALLGLLVLGLPSLGWTGPLRFLFEGANEAILGLLEFTNEGTRFIFGPLMDSESKGFIFAFKALPPIVFFSSLMGVLYSLRIMPLIVRAMALIMQKTLKTSGAESLAMAANVFVGQTEAPLMIRPYIEKMTQSELFSLMTGGMATVAGGVMAAYVGLLYDKIPDIAGHLLTASVMSAPAALAIAKILFPEVDQPVTAAGVPHDPTGTDAPRHVLEAAATGAADGLKMALNVAAMLLAFIALMAMTDAFLGKLGELLYFSSWGQEWVPMALQTPGEPVTLSLSLIFGWAFAPVAWLMGIPWNEALLSGALLGEKVVLNEMVAYLHLADLSTELTSRSAVILSYALCGFANFSCIAIQIGGIGELAPRRRSDLAHLGLKAVLGGNLAAFMTATMAGLLI